MKNLPRLQHCATWLPVSLNLCRVAFLIITPGSADVVSNLRFALIMIIDVSFPNPCSWLPPKLKTRTSLVLSPRLEIEIL